MHPFGPNSVEFAHELIITKNGYTFIFMTPLSTPYSVMEAAAKAITAKF